MSDQPQGNEQVNWEGMRADLQAAIVEADDNALMQFCMNLEVFVLVGGQAFPDEILELLLTSIQDDRFGVMNGGHCLLSSLCRFWSKLSPGQRTKTLRCVESHFLITKCRPSLLVITELLSEVDKSQAALAVVLRLRDLSPEDRRSYLPGALERFVLNSGDSAIIAEAKEALLAMSEKDQSLEIRADAAGALKRMRP